MASGTLAVGDITAALGLALARQPREGEVAKLQQDHASLDSLYTGLFQSFEFQRRMAGLAKDASWPDNEFAIARTVFMHIPKTAGTTIRQMLRLGKPKAAEFPDTNWLGGYPAHVLSRYELFSGHYTLHDIQHIPGTKHVLTVLREPRARLVSYYKYRRATIGHDRRQAAPGDRLASKLHLPLKEFLSDPDVRKNRNVFNTQARFLYCVTPEIAKGFGIRPGGRGAALRFGVNRQRTVDVVKANLAGLAGFGLVEQLDDFTRTVLPSLGIVPAATQRKLNVTEELATDAQRAVERPVIDDETDRLMDELVAIDEALYAFAKDLFAARSGSPGSSGLAAAA